jgi:surfeit locus 1 family protein
LSVALTGCVCALIALGVWQIERRSWKLALIEQVEARIHAPPGPMPLASSWPAINAANDAYRHIGVTGRFLHQRETLVKAVTDAGSGFWVVTPLQTDAGPIVLVNRGFVPPEKRDPATRREGQPQGSVTVSGLLRITEPKGAFLRNNDPKAEHWYSRDVAAIVAARGLHDAAPFFIDADADPNGGGAPVGGLTVVRFANNHLIYALTWFALAFMLAGALLLVARDRWLGRNPVGAARSFSGQTGADAEAIIESA